MNQPKTHPEDACRAAESGSAGSARQEPASAVVGDLLALNQSIISTSLLGIMAYHADGPCVLANDAAARVIGTTADRLQRQNFRQLASWRATGMLEAAETALSTWTPQRREMHGLSTYGKEIWLDCYLIPFRNGGEPHLLLTLVDVHARKQAEIALCASEENYRMLWERLKLATRAGRVGTWDWDRESGTMVWDDSMRELYGGITPSYASWRGALHPEDLTRAEQEIRDALAGAGPYDTEFRVRLPGGEVRRIQARGEVLRDDRGRPCRMVGTNMDITDLRQAESRLRMLSQAVEQSASSIVITDRQGVIRYVNARFTEVNGYTREEAIGQKPQLLRSGETDPAVYESLWKTILAGQDWRGEFKNRKKSGEVYWCFLTISAIKDDAGNIEHFVASQEDLSERKLAEETIRKLAYYDPLTSLPNRRLFREKLTQAVHWADRGQCHLALLYLDLDRFKQVNDSLGHASGDVLLRTVAKRLRTTVREGDTVARLGGDEFAVILNNLRRAEHAGRVAEKILAALRAPCIVDRHEIYVHASIGISVCPSDSTDADQLMRNADVALYSSKSRGRNTFQYYSQQINRNTLERLELESRLRKAIEREELHLEYQPLIDCRRGKVYGVEALARWRHPELGLVPPAKFIPLAEEINLIESIGEWVLRTACRQLTQWDAQGLPPLTLAVNLSALQFRAPNVDAQVALVLSEAGIAPQRLELEITETALMDNPDEAVRALNALRQRGVRVAVDDFGTGYSSLGYLKRLPVDELKIDRSFVEDMTEDGRAIAGMVIALARSLKLSVIAEGVETREQLDALQALGCQKVQGYYFSRPLPPEALAAFVAERTAPAGVDSPPPLSLTLQ